MATTLVQPYTTLERVRNELKNQDSYEEDWLKQCINDASRIVEDYCNRDFWYHDHTSAPYTVPVEDIICENIYLPWPVISLTKIESDDVEVDSDGWIVRNPKNNKGTAVVERHGGIDWLWSGRSIKQKIILGTAAAPPLIKLTGEFGYPITGVEVPPDGIPDQVRRAATLVASSVSGLWQRENVGLDGTKVSVLDTRITPEAKMLLKKWVWSYEV